MAAPKGEDGPRIETRDDVSNWEHRQKAVRGDRRSRHELTLKIARDWTVQVVVVVLLVASFCGLFGWMTWTGPITPASVLVALVSGWIGKQLERSRGR